jgi:pimeloyl-ACP methyl ester carboxylesterase
LLISFDFRLQTLLRRHKIKLGNLASWGVTSFHRAKDNASATGVLLADLLCRVRSSESGSGFVLMGHSLGGCLIYYTLRALAARREDYSTPRPIVEDAYVLGGALDGEETAGWDTATQAVSGRLYNCYSKHDDVLKNLFTLATFQKAAGICR